MSIRHTHDLALPIAGTGSDATTGLGACRKFDRALAGGREGFGEKPHFSQRTREMGHPSGGAHPSKTTEGGGSLFSGGAKVDQPPLAEAIGGE